MRLIFLKGSTKLNYCKTKNDWAELVEKEKKEYEIDLTDDEISRLKKQVQRNSRKSSV